MKLKLLKPTTPSQRHLIRVTNKNIKKKPLVKIKIKGLISSSGRNNSGKITVRRKGGGHKRKYRKIDFLRIRESIGIVCSIEYDPSRKANIASVYDYKKKFFFYIVAPKNLTIGNIVKSGAGSEAFTGNSLPISEIPEGSFVHNIAPKISGKAQINRSAGTFSTLKEKTPKHTKIKLNSGEIRIILNQCYASIGIVSNELYSLTRLGKAGQSRWLGRRPKVRGVATNPADHPHGGGEGKKSGKNLTPWGSPNKKGSTSRSCNKQIVKNR